MQERKHYSRSKILGVKPGSMINSLAIKNDAKLRRLMREGYLKRERHPHPSKPNARIDVYFRTDKPYIPQADVRNQGHRNGFDFSYHASRFQDE